jgi:hypothetical protein
LWTVIFSFPLTFDFFYNFPPNFGHVLRYKFLTSRKNPHISSTPDYFSSANRQIGSESYLLHRTPSPPHRFWSILTASRRRHRHCRTHPFSSAPLLVPFHRSHASQRGKRVQPQLQLLIHTSPPATSSATSSHPSPPGEDLRFLLAAKNWSRSGIRI